MEIETIEYTVEETLSIEASESPITYRDTTVVTHGSLIDRNNDNQHTINAITGLTEKLNQLESLKPVQSNGTGFAEYHMWQDKNPSIKDRTGRFVSFYVNEKGKGTDMIVISNNNVCGVTISPDSVAFAGNQDIEHRDTSYGLVCPIGSVRVVCADDVKVGDRVKPGKVGDKDGCAVKDENGYYLVTAVEPVLNVNYAVINFTSSIGAIIDEITVSRATEAVNYDKNNGAIKTKFDDIDTEITGIKDGTTIVEKAAYSIDADNYTEDGTIKSKFDNVDTEIVNIVKGVTVVAEANHSVNADNYTENGEIKRKFNEIDQYILDIEGGIVHVGKALSDVNGNPFNDNYYYLHAIDNNDLRFISSNKTILPYDSFNINTLCKSKDCGIYVIDYNMIKNGLVTGLPKDEIFPNSGATVKLIVESAGDIESEETLPSVYQTLKIRTTKDAQNANLLMYHRVVVGVSGANKTPIWSDWQRFVSASELPNNTLYLHSIELSISKHAVKVGDIRLDVISHTDQEINVHDYLNTKSFYNLSGSAPSHIYPATGQIFNSDGSLLGIVNGVYACRYASVGGGLVNTIGYTYFDLSTPAYSYAIVNEEQVYTVNDIINKV